MLQLKSFYMFTNVVIMLLSMEKNKYFVKEISLEGEGYSIILQYSKFGESKDIYRKPEPPAQTLGSFLRPIVSADEKRSMLGTVLRPKGMVERLRWEVRKGNIQYKIYLNWSDSYFTNPFIIFPHIVSQTFREADEELRRGKKTQRRENTGVHRSEVCMHWTGAPVERSMWVSQGHRVYELLTIYISVNSSARRHLQIKCFMQKQFVEFFHLLNAKHKKLRVERRLQCLGITTLL